VTVYPWRIWAAGLHLRLGDPASAVALADQELEIAEAWGADAGWGRALRVRGQLDDTKAGTELLHQAVHVLAGSANVLERAKAEMALGRRLTDREAGAAMLARGRRTAEQCGARWLFDYGHKDAAVRPSRTRRAADPRLTEAEHRVAVRAVGGSSNQSIADELSISVRAVEKHLTSVYRKLDVPGRAGLALALRVESRVPGPSGA
jgi:DNA-binding CsgD family transcriptional regulator